MAIILKTAAQINNYDVYLKVNFKRERKDIANLLIRLNNGDTLHDVFKNEIIVNSVKNFLKDNGFITETQKVSTKGSHFIESPYFNEEEEGVFSIDVVSLQLGGTNFSFVSKMTRKLDEERRDQCDLSLQSLTYENTFNLENEKCVIELLENKSRKAYLGHAKNTTIELNAATSQYSVDGVDGVLGERMAFYLQSEVKNIIETNNPELVYNETERTISIDSINNLTDKEIMCGALERTISNVTLKSEHYKITNVRNAVAYAYSYAYCLLDNGKFLSTNDLNDIFVNEILSGKNIHESIKDELLSFKYSLGDFSSKLPKEKYEKLDYRLRIVQELLDVNAIENSDKSFMSLRNYEEIASYLSNKVHPSEVRELYLVMGYAFVQNKKNPNRIIECLSCLNKVYDQITVVDKAPTQDNADKNLINQIKGMGVKVVHKPAISDYFHDRYLIFKLSNGSYEVYMISAEIGQIFGSDNHIRGNVHHQNLSDVAMTGRNLIEIALGR